MIPLSATRRRELRAAAHHLNPVVSVAGNGLSASVVAEIDQALRSHELIKVRVYGEDRDNRAALMEAICTQVAALAVQHIGNILVLWRENTAEPVSAADAPTAKPRARVRAPKSTGSESFARAARAKVLAPTRGQRQVATARPRTRGPQR